MADEEVVQLTAESDSSVFVFATTAAASSSGVSAKGGIYDEEGNIQENSLIENLGRTFFDTGSVPTSEINSKIELIKIAFEDAGGCDQDLIDAIIHSDFALVSFLLNVVFKSSAGCEDTAAKCLAFAGDIYSSLWTDYCAAAPRLLLVLQACKTASLRIEQLQYSLPAKASPNEHGAYLGYDERDIADFDMEGYEAGEDKTQQEERVLQIQEAVMVWFLFLFQVFSQPLPSINKKIISCRTRKSTGGRYSSRRVAKTAVPELTTDLFAEETTLDSLDLVEYFTGLAEALLGFLLKKGLSEDAHNQCVKVVVLLNAQLPRLQSADTNEVAALFAKLDSSGEAGENLTQGLLYLLNENGYPHIHSCDTLAAVRMCKDLLNVEYSPENAEDSDALGEGLTSPHSAQGSVDSSFARGHFYTNDVKVMVDIVVRELCNIPHNTSGLTTTSVEAGNGRYGSSSGSGGKSRSSPSSADQVAAVIHGTLRFAYLELLDAIVSRSTWTSSGDCYMKEQLRVQLEEVVSKKDGDEQSRLFAADLLAKYSYYLN